MPNDNRAGCMHVRVEYSGRCPTGGEAPLGDVLRELRDAGRALSDWPEERIVEVLAAFGERLLDRGNPIHGQYPLSGLSFVAGWCERNRLLRLVEDALGDPRVLDRYLPRRAAPGREYRAFPRGLVVHWMAGNVPTLGLLSLLTGLLTKNANAVKLPHGEPGLLPRLLRELAEVFPGESLNGAELARCAAVLRYERTRRDVAETLSGQADVRVVWGSDASVSAIRSLPCRPDAVDVAFPNRTSCMILGPEALDVARREKVARRAATDICVFEQKACASPHTVLLLTPDREAGRAFCAELARALEHAVRVAPPAAPDPREVAAILNLRSQYDMFYDAWYPSGTRYTVLMDDKEQLGPAIGGRTVFVRCLPDVQRIAELLPENIQSVGLAVEGEARERLTNLLGARGVHRFPAVGGMTAFDLPWDGHLVLQSLVRWTSRPGEASGR